MRRRIAHIAVAAAMIIMAALSSPASAKGWEAVRTDVSQLKSVAHDSEIEIRVSPGQIVVSSSHQVQIKIFTILGQVVSDETLSAGVSRMPLSHGVYIVKAGDLTCKIAV